MTDQGKTEFICDGELEIINITPELHDEVWKFYKTIFMKNENVSIALEFLNSEASLKEIEIVARKVFEDGFGYIVRHCSTNEIVAFCVNKIYTADMDPMLGFQFQEPNVICGGEFVQRMKASFDLFKEWNLDCVMEIEFLCTRNDFGGRGIARLLCERSIDFAQQMKNGTLSKNAVLPAEVKDSKPQAVCSIFTSLFTQKVGEKVGMETLVKIPYTEFVYDGKTFAEKIDPIHKSAVYAAIKL